ncbi:MAG: aspartate--tRNA ligase [Silvanigrellales bacterium]|nr:aspartate--tRNA ligase [Silvanigrellales bacterium]
MAQELEQGKRQLRTHTCGQLNAAHAGAEVTLMGWVNACRNLGGLVFVDLRDHHGVTQVVVNPGSDFFDTAATLRNESVIEVKGQVIRRQGAVNAKIPTGEIEVVAAALRVESPAEVLPFQVAHTTHEESEDTRLKYRFLDLRTERMQKNVKMRSQVIHHLRNTMTDLGFLEFQTPILTSSSPEGARDFLVPSRTHPGKFYALPQAPQQFKQLLMCSGFDRYFQIAPCFRDEDARADRSPGEFYQLDIEMAFATQDDVFDTVEKVMIDTFTKFSKRKIQKTPFPRIPFREALDKYGSDKPDLRFELAWTNVEELFANTALGFFKQALAGGGFLRGVRVPGVASQSRKFFDEAEAFAKEAGLGGLPYATWKDGEWKGSVAKGLGDSEKAGLVAHLGLQNGDGVFFLLGPAGQNAAQRLKTQTLGGKVRLWLAEKLGLRSKDEWAFCWIVDFPFYEWNEEEGRIDFCHNPFSMPQGGLEALDAKEPLDILAYQYDIVCNGVELSSGAIRNHRRDVMKKAFALAGYTEGDIESKFPALWNAFAYGAPPHGGIAPGVDRIVMLLLDEPNIREIIAFPLNQKAQDLLMNAPSHVNEKQLRDVHVKLDVKP